VRRLLVAAGAFCLTLGACGGQSSDQMVRSGTTPIERKADGTLSSTPSPLTLRDVEKQPDGSAGRAVMQLIFWAQWGNLPAIINTYDSRVAGTLGVSKLAGSYEYLRPELLTSRPRIIAAQPSSGGQFVSLELTSTRGGPAREGFLLRRRNGAWRIVYDTLLERALEGSTIAEQAPNDPTPSLAVRRAGARAAGLYRDTYPSLALGVAERAGQPR
jgi:hypothetical protein